MRSPVPPAEMISYFELFLSIYRVGNQKMAAHIYSTLLPSDRVLESSEVSYANVLKILEGVGDGNWTGLVGFFDCQIHVYCGCSGVHHSLLPSLLFPLSR